VPIHKKNSTLLKGNYRPVSILPTISTIFERDIDERFLSSFKIMSVSKLHPLLVKKGFIVGQKYLFFGPPTHLSRK
jgi:hypothetical protein